MSDLWGAPITANLLTGFLGAGKTSLLQRFLSQPSLTDTAVLINEFGEVGLDHVLIEEVDEDVVLLASGCVCCTIRGDLKEALTGLYGRRQRGKVPPFKRLVIETTGLADPAPIVATLCADPALAHHFSVGNIVTVVDGENGLATLDAYEESQRQVAVADHLVVSKTDIAAPDRLRSLSARLRQMNPAAELSLSSESDPAPATLLTRDINDEATRDDQARRWLAAEVESAHHHTIDRNRHGDIRAMVLAADVPLDWAAFGLWLSMLLNRHGADILRVKGLLNIVGRSGPVVVQGVQHLVHPPTHLKRWPDGRAATRLVVIARGLNSGLIERSFRSFMALGEEPAQRYTSASSA